MELFFPPQQSICGNFIIPFRETNLKQEQKYLISMLLDECVFEIFECLKATQDHNVSTYVSKRWIMLQITMQRSEIKRSKPNPKTYG